MIPRKKKVCINCYLERYIFSRKMCLSCFQRANPNKIAKRSKKGKQDDREYSKLAKQFKSENPLCKARLTGCTGHTSDVHHMRGRGAMLLKTEYWLPVCRNCHNIITDDSALAFSEGFSLSRLSNS